MPNGLSIGRYDLGGRIFFRPIRENDGVLVAYWRNTPSARRSFYSQSIVTPDTHARWLAQKDPLDQVWIVQLKEEEEFAIGMVALRVDHSFQGEYGRLYLDPAYRLIGGYGLEIEYTALAIGFEFYFLERIWADVLANNDSALSMKEMTGFTREGIDVPGHTNNRGPVVHFTYTRATWEEHKVEPTVRYAWSL